jgi:hypothetical protein
MLLLPPIKVIIATVVVYTEATTTLAVEVRLLFSTTIREAILVLSLVRYVVSHLMLKSRSLQKPSLSLAIIMT